MKTVPKVLVMFAGLSFALAGQAAETLTIATVNNADMIRMQKLSKTFESEHPDIKLNWVVLEENVLRQRLTTDIATQGGQFDVLTIGTYETPLWGAKHWLEPMTNLPAEYDLEDIFLPFAKASRSMTRFTPCPFTAKAPSPITARTCSNRPA